MPARAGNAVGDRLQYPHYGPTVSPAEVPPVERLRPALAHS